MFVYGVQSENKIDYGVFGKIYLILWRKRYVRAEKATRYVFLIVVKKYFRKLPILIRPLEP